VSNEENKVTGKKELHNRIANGKVPQKSISKPTSNAKKVTLLTLPSLKAFGSTLPIATSVEKGQINEISVEVAGKGNPLLIYAESQFINGLNPNQAEFLFNAIVGGSGTARGARQLGFAAWVNEVASKFKQLGFSKEPADYNVIVNYAARGGMMIFNVKDLITMCGIKTNAARESFKRYPRQANEPKTRNSKVTEAEVSVAL
jgi:hypothetical protein